MQVSHSYALWTGYQSVRETGLLTNNKILAIQAELEENQAGFLNVPVLYLSRHIVRTKADYYRLLQAVREEGAWEDWVLYMLAAVECTARDTTRTVALIRDAFMEAKHRIRDRFKFYSQDLINNLFTHPYTKIAFIQKDLGVTRVTATRYLDELASAGFLEKRKIGRTNYYLNLPLIHILSGP